MKRLTFLRKLIHQLATPWLRERYACRHLKQDTLDAVKTCLSVCDPEFEDETRPVPVKAAGEPARCYICVADIKEMERGEERKRRNKNINKQSWFCPECNLAVCTKKQHRLYVPGHLNGICSECFKA